MNSLMVWFLLCIPFPANSIRLTSKSTPHKVKQLENWNTPVLKVKHRSHSTFSFLISWFRDEDLGEGAKWFFYRRILLESNETDTGDR